MKIRKNSSFTLQGFTLVELLVVITIIIIMSVIISLIFKNISPSAKDSRRKADLATIQKSLELYRFDNGTYPSQLPFGSKLTSLDGAISYLDPVPKDPKPLPYPQYYYESAPAGCTNNCSSYTLVAKLEKPPAGASTYQFDGIDYDYLPPLANNNAPSNPSPTAIPILCPSTGLIGYWKLNEASWNGTVGEVIDSAGTSHGTAINGAYTTTGKYGRAGVFDGNNDYISTSNTSIPTQLTVTVWFFKNADTTWHALVGKSATNFYDGYSFKASENGNGKVIIWTGNGSSWTVIQDPNVTSTNAWHFAAFTYDGTTVRLYVDGVLKNSGGASAIYDSASSPLRIGRHGTSVSELFNGLIDDVRVYNRALTPTEITDIYQTCTP